MAGGGGGWAIVNDVDAFLFAGSANGAGTSLAGGRLA